MKKHILIAAALFGLAAMPTMGAQPGPAAAGSAAQGRQLFREQCLLCHSAEPGDNGGAQGPNLAGLLGRKAASGEGFNYTPALKNSGITWDAATLARFLASPTQAVPGTSMVIPVPNETDRNNLVAYFTALRDGTLPASSPPRGFGGGFGPPRAPAGPPPGDPEWKNDGPGVVHRIDLDKLPEPFATPSATNFPQVVPKPADAQLKVPAGFKVEVYLTGLTGPRNMQVAPNGDVFLAETNAGRIKVLRPTADGRTATPTVFAQGLQQPYGIAFYPSAQNPEWVYIAEVNRVVRYAYRVGDTVARALPEIVIPRLSPVGGGHFTRDIVFSKDGSKLYVAVGSQGNIFADSIAKKSPAEAAAWDRQHGLGAPWGLEENRAMVRVYDLRSGDTVGKAYATGIRNCVGLTMQPATGELWCAVNERDGLGDDLVPDYATRVKEGAFYGWPWYYMGDYEEPRMKGDRPDLRGKVTRPDVPFVAHSAATNIQFYNAKEGASLFPPEYHGVPFVVLHGSWNRAHRTGHKIVTLKMRGNEPTGEYVDFLTGFITPDNQAWGRPVAIQVLKDGSMLLADDGANLIYRISYSKP